MPNALRPFVLCALLLLPWVPAASGEEPMSDSLRAIVEAPLIAQADLDDEALAVDRDLPYTAEGAEGPRLDVYRLQKAASTPRPVILYVHGGPRPPGDFPESIFRPKDWQFFRDHGGLAAARDFVAVIPNHRYRSTGEIERSFADLRAVLRWLKQHGEEIGADPQRVGLWLFSGAGAHLGWLAVEAPPEIRAAVAFYPVAAFAPFAAMGLGETPPEIVERWDPAAHVSAALPPLLLARAGKDSPAINSSIDAFAAAATAAGTTLDLLIHPTGQHGFDLRDDVPRSHEILERALDFFEHHLSD